MNDVVFKSENRLITVKKPGVVTATTTSASTAAKRIATRTRPRVECGSGKRHGSWGVAGKACSVMTIS
jgi:hypothetical protein